MCLIEQSQQAYSSGKTELPGEPKVIFLNSSPNPEEIIFLVALIDKNGLDTLGRFPKNHVITAED